MTFYDAQDRIVAYGSHTKHMGKNVPITRFSEDGEEELDPEEAMEERARL